jgi:hypothetical protein
MPEIVEPEALDLRALQRSLERCADLAPPRPILATEQEPLALLRIGLKGTESRVNVDVHSTAADRSWSCRRRPAPSRSKNGKPTPRGRLRTIDAMDTISRRRLIRFCERMYGLTLMEMFWKFVFLF